MKAISLLSKWSSVPVSAVNVVLAVLTLLLSLFVLYKISDFQSAKEEIIIASCGLFVLIIIYFWARVIAPSKIYDEQAEKIRSFEEKLEPKLQIEFKEKGEAFFQEIKEYLDKTSADVLYGSGARLYAILQTYRIKVSNRGLEPIKNVQVKLLSIDPMPENLHGLPCNLRIMNDNKPTPDIKRGIQNDASEFIDVVNYRIRKIVQRKIISEGIGDPLPMEVLLINRIDGVTSFIPTDKPYDIEIGVTGDNIIGEKRKFKIGIKNENLFMEQT